MSSEPLTEAPDETQAAVKETRRRLRLVQSHLMQTSINHGANVQSHGFVDVVAHASSAANELNYVTPRKNTAWVSGKEIEHGLDALRAAGRMGRVQYIEGLFPAQFASTLTALNLSVEQEAPLMLLTRDDSKRIFAPLPEGVIINQVTGTEGSAVWWYVWRSAYYDVITQTAPPVAVGMDLYHISSGHQIDFVMQRGGVPVGVARLSLNPENATAHIEALALIREARQPRLMRALIARVTATAWEQGAALVFSGGQSERDTFREAGFIDCGSIVWYAENATDTKLDEQNGGMAQPLLTVR